VLVTSLLTENNPPILRTSTNYYFVCTNNNLHENVLCVASRIVEHNFTIKLWSCQLLKSQYVRRSGWYSNPAPPNLFDTPERAQLFTPVNKIQMLACSVLVLEATTPSCTPLFLLWKMKGNIPQCWRESCRRNGTEVSTESWVRGTVKCLLRLTGQMNRIRGIICLITRFQLYYAVSLLS
jgi:hypothetical protein